MTTEEQNIINNINIAKFLRCKVTETFLNSIIQDFTITGEIVKELRSINPKIGGMENKCLMSNFKFDSDWNSLMFLIKKINFHYFNYEFDDNDFKIGSNLSLMDEALKNCDIDTVFLAITQYINLISENGK